MHGAGNDYIYVNIMEYTLSDPEKTSIAWSKRHTGIGSDGLVLIGPSGSADFSMRIFNNDGSEAMMCGNASRCVAKYLFDNKLTEKTEIRLETRSGIKLLKLFTTPNGYVEEVMVDMGEPLFENEEQFDASLETMKENTLFAKGKKYIGTFVCMGNPHFVIFVPDITQINLELEGPALEHHFAFPQRCNIEFAEVRADGTVRMRVWERGSGITLACGTGACATAVAAVIRNKAKRKSTITMDGGTLSVEWNPDNNHIYMKGPAVKVFDGEIELED